MAEVVVGSKSTAGTAAVNPKQKKSDLDSKKKKKKRKY